MHVLNESYSLNLFVSCAASHMADGFTSSDLNVVFVVDER